uniref:ATP synthase protein 8 n=1 Tax=Ramalina intermedia TaxID=86788 RepID=A0A5B8HM25_9LECA|nr:ATP synthase F0 subunit 8 [Ramalina intermedia]QDX14930.1 ATP synthase F0 subunit 8 [Ramalina intermedia]
MPQLVPFYFTNETIFVFFILTLMVYTFSKYTLPSSACLLKTRVIISGLQ